MQLSASSPTFLTVDVAAAVHLELRIPQLCREHKHLFSFPSPATTPMYETTRTRSQTWRHAEVDFLKNIRWVFCRCTSSRLASLLLWCPCWTWWWWNPPNVDGRRLRFSMRALAARVTWT